ncbi:hypothetical protein HELRODRAFT_176452 [Helobdella robusta]|uniref:Uncharacterized protein n=1 Tax=Helobdella robusta TaxID=6412 RepID=T1FAI6_HELRO|nr:hypothetical protein HELRODRAFT_176452 [Helobdella robusta]ESN99691.1 hypothetical protein HELRODRAFT_176452 [Helobdella robusta]
MSFFKSVAGLLSDITQKVTGASPPFQVSEISPSYYQNFSLITDDETFKLYQEKKVYKAVLCPLNSKKHFLIFVLPTYEEAREAFNLLSYRLQVLMQCMNLVNVQQIQKISDITREHPGRDHQYGIFCDRNIA